MSKNSDTSSMPGAKPRVVLMLTIEAASVNREALVADLRRRAEHDPDGFVSEGTSINDDLLDDGLHVTVVLSSPRTEAVESLIGQHPDMNAVATIVTEGCDDRWMADFAKGLRVSEWRHVWVPLGQTHMFVSGPQDELERFTRATAAPRPHDVDLVRWRSLELEREVRSDGLVLRHYALDVRRTPERIEELSALFPALEFRARVTPNDSSMPSLAAVLVAGQAVDGWTEAVG